MNRIQIDARLSNKKTFVPRNCEVCPMLACGMVDWCNYYNKRIDVPDSKPDFCEVKSIIVEE